MARRRPCMQAGAAGVRTSPVGQPGEGRRNCQVLRPFPERPFSLVVAMSLRHQAHSLCTVQGCPPAASAARLESAAASHALDLGRSCVAQCTAHCAKVIAVHCAAARRVGIGRGRQRLRVGHAWAAASSAGCGIAPLRGGVIARTRFQGWRVIRRARYGHSACRGQGPQNDQARPGLRPRPVFVQARPAAAVRTWLQCGAAGLEVCTMPGRACGSTVRAPTAPCPRCHMHPAKRGAPSRQWPVVLQSPQGGRVQGGRASDARARARTRLRTCTVGS